MSESVEETVEAPETAPERTETDAQADRVEGVVEHSPAAEKALRDVAKYRKRMREAEEATKAVEARIADAESRAVKAERRYIATLHGLPPQLADRLQGENLEELGADAQRLVEAMGTSQRTPQGPRVVSAPTRVIPDDHELWKQALAR